MVQNVFPTLGVKYWSSLTVLLFVPKIKHSAWNFLIKNRCTLDMQMSFRQAKKFRQKSFLLTISLQINVTKNFISQTKRNSSKLVENFRN